MKRAIPNILQTIAVIMTFMFLTVDVVARQQVEDAGILRFYQGGTEVGRESFRKTATVLTTDTQVPLADLRLTYRVEYQNDRLVNMEAVAYSLSGDSIIRRYTAVADGDSLRLSQTESNGSTRNWSALARPDAALGTQTLAGLGDMIARAQRRDRTFTVWSPEQNSTTEMPITFSGDSARVQAGPLLVLATIDAAGRAQSFSIPASGLTAVRAGTETLEPLAGIPRLTPDYTAGPDDPYVAEDVRIPVAPIDGEVFSLAGTLTLPTSTAPPYPVVVMITGSGGQDRDESLWPLIPEYRPFRQMARRFAAEGIATLRVDDRGVGSSEGDASAATTEDLAGDTRAQVDWLRMRSDIDTDRIVLAGHSEGGIIAPMLTARDEELAAIIIMAGTSKPGIDVLRDQVLWPLETAEGLSDGDRAEARKNALEQVETTISDTTPWMRWFRDYDPLVTIRDVTQPTLILHGEFDRQVTVGQADTLASALREAGNQNVELHKFPNLNHLFLPSIKDGSPSEYAALPVTDVPAQVLDTMAEWLVRILRPRS